MLFLQWEELKCRISYAKLLACLFPLLHRWRSFAFHRPLHICLNVRIGIFTPLASASCSCVTPCSFRSAFTFSKNFDSIFSALPLLCVQYDIGKAKIERTTGTNRRNFFILPVRVPLLKRKTHSGNHSAVGQNTINSRLNLVNAFHAIASRP